MDGVLASASATVLAVLRLVLSMMITSYRIARIDPKNRYAIGALVFVVVRLA